VAITEAQVKAIVIGRVGDIDPSTLDPTVANTGLLAVNIDLWWEMHADKALWGPRLQELYTQLECVDAKKAALMHLVDFSDGATSVNVKQNQKILALDTMRAGLLIRIAQLEQIYAKSFRNGVLVPLNQTAPVMPPVIPRTGPVDANDPRFAGDPYLFSTDPV
jgi:hypothetical protein